MVIRANRENALNCAGSTDTSVTLNNVVEVEEVAEPNFPTKLKIIRSKLKDKANSSGAIRTTITPKKIVYETTDADMSALSV